MYGDNSRGGGPDDDGDDGNDGNDDNDDDDDDDDVNGGGFGGDIKASVPDVSRATVSRVSFVSQGTLCGDVLVKRLAGSQGWESLYCLSSRDALCMYAPISRPIAIMLR